MTQVCRFAFTLFITDDVNTSKDDLEDGLQHLGAKYFIFQKERCPDTGKEHWQGYCRLARSKRFNVVKNEFPTIHLEKCRGTEEQNVEYCSKENSRVEGPFEWGERTMRGKRKDIDTVREMVRAGKRLREIADEVSSYQALRFAQNYITLQPVRQREAPLVYWLHGSTGSGKTRWCWDRVHSMKVDCWCSHDTLQWFDGYQGQPVVIIDDFRGSSAKFSFLLKLLDRYPLKVPVKGSYVDWVPEVIMVTSPYKPEDVYRNKSDEDISQLTRRISTVMLFGQEVPLASHNIIN